MWEKLSQWLRGDLPNDRTEKPERALHPIQEVTQPQAHSKSLATLAQEGLLAKALEDRTLLEA